jgi:alginate O-acetyltransferase complex protein AlgJ
MHDKSLSLISSAILSFCFLAVLVLPSVETLLHFGPHIELPEKRTLQVYPRFKWNKKALLSFPARFEAAFNDRFGFRAFLVRTQALAKFYWLHMSPSSKVVLGRDGWLYLAESIDEYLGIRRLPRARVQKWLQEFKAKKVFFDSRNIKYLVVIAPNKETVYPEFLPTTIQQIRNKLYIDDLMNALPADSRPSILDLREPLISAKGTGRLYLQTDSHWNQLGAAIASDAITNRLSLWFPELQPRLNQKIFEIRTSNSGDLAQLMGLQDRLREETIVISHIPESLHPAPLRSRATMKRILSNEAVESWNGKQRRHAVVTGDSFTNTLNMFLPAHFRRTLKIRPLVSYQDPFFQSIIEAEKPDVYIELVVDRHLANPPQVKARKLLEPED